MATKHPATRRRPRTRTNRRRLAGAAAAVVLSATFSACGASPGTLTVSPVSGPPGTIVNVKGNAGAGCVVDKNWFGFNFEHYGELSSGPVTQMTTPVLTNGSWSASFTVPSFLGGSASRGPGAPVAPGRYELVAPTCNGTKVGKATFQVTGGVPRGSATAYVAIEVTPDANGYWLVQANGKVTAYGAAKTYGEAETATPGAGAIPAGTRIVGMARTYNAHGYWLAASDGNVYSFGDAHFYGSLVSERKTPPAPITSIAGAPNGKGYWLLSANGSVFGFGDAKVIGAPNSYLAPYDAIEARPAGGYVVTSADDGAVFLYPGGVLSAFGPGAAFAATLVGTALTPSGNASWEVGSDGGVFTSGSPLPAFYGSVPGENDVLKAPITAMAATPAGNGYWLLGANGAVFPFGAAATLPAAPATH